MRTAEAIHRHYADHPALAGYHEAGHALVALRVGWDVRTVHAGRVGDSGHTDLVPDDADPAARLAVFMAGMRAERRCRSWDPALAGHAEDDDREVTRAARTLGVRSLSAYERIVDDLLYEDRRGLDRLAAELVERHEVAGREAVALLTGRETS